MTAKEQMKRLMGNIGSLLPFDVRLRWARRSTRWGHFLRNAGSFVIPDYAGSISVQIDTRYNVEREMLTGIYESDVAAVIEEHVIVGDCCIDVGANIGAITLLLCKRVGNSGKVISFEPGPDYF